MAKRLKWGSIEDLQAKINEFFALREAKGEPPTIAGLCLHLGVSSEFWKYYTSDRWRLYKKSEQETEEVTKNIAESLDNEGFEEYTSINQYMEVIDNAEDLKTWEKGEEYTIKSRVSATLKIAAQKFEDYTVQQIFTAKNPAGAIYYSKAALGYRETAPEQSNSNQLPSKITIQIMPAPDKPELQQPTKVSINTSSE